MRKFITSLTAASLLLLSACETKIQSRLSEMQADEIIVALNQQSIGASKESASRANEAPLYDVSVASADTSAALAVLHSLGLPRPNNAGLSEVFGKGGLVPTATEERARFIAAVSGELAGSIESMDSVVDARVHLALPDDHALLLDDEKPMARASVLIKRVSGSPSIAANAVQELVAGAIQDLQASRVAVVQIETASPPSASPLVRVGPFSVSPSSAGPLKVTLVGLIVGFFLVGALIGFLFRSTRRG